MIAVETAGRDEYDNLEQAKSKAAAIGIASLWASGNTEDVLKGKQIYDGEKMRQGYITKLKKMSGNEASN